jgi:N utilization substance protein A
MLKIRQPDFCPVSALCIVSLLTEADADEKSEQEARELLKMFMEQLDVDEDVALILVQEGYSSMEELAYVPAKELLSIEEFDEAIVDELRNRARDVLLTRAIASEEVIDNAEPAEDLLSLDGMEKGLAYVLASKGIVTREDLADQAVDELLEIENMDEERAAALIMAARAHWFEDEEQAS